MNEHVSMPEIADIPTAAYVRSETRTLEDGLSRAESRLASREAGLPRGWLAQHLPFLRKKEKQAYINASVGVKSARQRLDNHIQESSQYRDHFREEAVAFEEERTSAWQALTEELAWTQEILGTDPAYKGPALNEFLSSYWFTEKGDVLGKEAKRRALSLAFRPKQPEGQPVLGLPIKEELYWGMDTYILSPGLGFPIDEALQDATDQNWQHLIKIDYTYQDTRRTPDSAAKKWSCYIAVPTELAEKYSDSIAENDSYQSGDLFKKNTTRAYLNAHHCLIGLEEAKRIDRVENAPFKAVLGGPIGQPEIHMHSDDENELRKQVLGRVLAHRGLQRMTLSINGEEIKLTDFLLSTDNQK